MIVGITKSKYSHSSVNLYRQKDILKYKRQNVIYLGIKHDLLCINICLAPREVLKRKPERRGFQHPTRGSADVNVSEKHV